MNRYFTCHSDYLILYRGIQRSNAILNDAVRLIICGKKYKSALQVPTTQQQNKLSTLR